MRAAPRLLRPRFAVAMVACGAAGGASRSQRAGLTPSKRRDQVSVTPNWRLRRCVLMQELDHPLVVDVQEEASSSSATPTAKPPATPRIKNAGNVNVDQEMLKSRRIFLTGEINDESAKAVIQQLLYLEAEDPDAPVTLYINSGGGLVHSGVAILDVMRHLSAPPRTVAYGRCLSIAALVLAAGQPGHRTCYMNTQLMIHQVSCSYAKQQAQDLFVKVDELRNTQNTLERILSETTGRPEAEIQAALSRDRYMSPLEARDFGIVDAILQDAMVRSSRAETGAAGDAEARAAAEPMAADPPPCAGDHPTN